MRCFKKISNINPHFPVFSVECRCYQLDKLYIYPTISKEFEDFMKVYDTTKIYKKGLVTINTNEAASTQNGILILNYNVNTQLFKIKILERILQENTILIIDNYEPDIFQ